MKWHIGKLALRILPAVALSLGAALVDANLLDAKAYRAALAVGELLGVAPVVKPSSS